MDFPVAIGRRLREARKSLHLRQSDLAERVGIAGSHLSDIERGVLIPTLPTLQKLGEALDRPLEYFLVEPAVNPRALGTVMFRVSLGELSAMRFAQLVHDKTAGAVSIQLYQHVQAGDIYDQVCGLVEGSVQILIDDLLSLERYAPLLAVVHQPFFFRDGEHYRRFLASAIFQTQVREKLLESGIRLLNPLAAPAGDPFELLFATTPIFHPADLAGKRFRSYASPVADQLRRALGTEPVRVHWGQGGQALADGLIDAFLLPAHHHASLDLHHTAKYATYLNYGYMPSLVIAINDHEYRKLPPDLQHILAEAVEETERHFSRAVDQQAAQYLARLPEQGVAVIHPDLRVWRAAFAQALRAVCLERGHLPAACYEALQAL